MRSGELQDMGGQLATWAGAISDIEFLAKKAENPPWWKVGGNVQAEAIEILQPRRRSKPSAMNCAPLRPLLRQSGWEELMRLRRRFKRKQATDHRR